MRKSHVSRHALKFIRKRASLPPLGLLTVAAMLPEDWAKHLVDGTKPSRRCTWHGGTHPKFPRLIAGGTHHPALRRGRADDHRPAAQPWVVALFHRSVKRVHIRMEDDTMHRQGRLPRTLQSQNICPVLSSARLGETAGHPFSSRVHSRLFESMRMVTGPSLVRLTFMSAPNSPVWMFLPKSSVSQRMNCS